MVTDPSLFDSDETGAKAISWVRKNAFSLLIGIVFGVTCIVAWHFWKNNQFSKHMDASGQYQKITTLLDSKKLDEARAQINQMDWADDGIYFDLASLQVAKALAEKNKLADASAVLRNLQHSDPALQPIIRLRLAHLLFSQSKPEEAITLISSQQDPASLELLGDIYMFQNKRDAARSSYEQALNALEPNSMLRVILQAKLTQSGGHPVSSSEMATTE